MCWSAFLEVSAKDFLLPKSTPIILAKNVLECTVSQDLLLLKSTPI